MNIQSGPSFHDFKKNSHVGQFPDAFTKMIKSYGETYFWEKGNFHVITKANHAKEILTSKNFSADRGRFFISRMPNLDLNLIKDFFGVVKLMMVMSDDNAHTRRRSAAAAGFEDHILDNFHVVMEKTVRRIVEQFKDKSEIEFVESISKILPSTVLADLFSIPEEDRDNFLKWSNIMTGFFGGASQYRNEDGIEVNTAALSLKTYFTKLVKERSQNPGRDYVSLLIGMQGKLDLTDDELISQLIMMLVAGMATTTDQINNNMFLLATHPEIQEEVRSNPELIPQMIEEFKRYDPAVTFIFRVARADCMIGDQPIKNGDVMFISTHAINRDFPEEMKPDYIDIHRKLPNFAYGHGPHYCIGAKLARMEMQTLFTQLLKVLPRFELHPTKESIRDHYSLSFSGFKELHLKVL